MVLGPRTPRLMLTPCEPRRLVEPRTQEVQSSLPTEAVGVKGDSAPSFAIVMQRAHDPQAELMAPFALFAEGQPTNVAG